MVTTFTTYLENKILDYVFGKVSYTPPASIYVGLSATEPGKAGAFTGEPSGSGYGRVELTNNTTSFPLADTGSKSVGVAIEFPEVTGSLGELKYGFLADASTGGNMLGYGELSTYKSPTDGDIVYYKVGDLIIKFKQTA